VSRRLLNPPLFLRTLAANRVRLLVTLVAMLLWGFVLPVIYATFGKELGEFIRGNPLFNQFARFGGGDLFSLSGSIALGFVHPISLLLMGIMAIGFPAVAVAGELQRGTLEVLLARPISRRAMFATLYVAGLVFLGLLVAAQLGGAFVGSVVMGVAGELETANLVPLWLNGWLLFVAFMSLAFAVSVASDRIGPAIGIPLAFVLANYVANVIGSIWPDVSWLQDWSMFILVKAQEVLEEGTVVADVAILAAFSAVFVAVSLVVFPRRDLSAPA
jgi:ABC-2 type transport system permease protein